MHNHKKKIIAPVIVAAIILVYCVIYFGFLMAALTGFMKYALGIIPLGLAGVMIYVCVERIKEIRKGEEDDLSQY